MSTLTAIGFPATDAAAEGEWLSWRAQGLGASDLPAILGLSPHRTALDTYMDKTGQGQPVAESLAMFLGKAAEPRIAAWYERDTGHTLGRQQVRVTAIERPHMRATLDAIRDDGLLVEMKLVLNRGTREFGEDGSDELPESFLVQGHGQMYAAGAERMHFAVASPSWPDLRLFEVRRDERLMAAILEAADEFWGRVVDRRPPPFATPADLRHAATLYGDDGPEVELGEAGAGLWRHYAELGVVVSEAQKERDGVKAELFNALGAAASGRLPDGSRVVRKVVKRKSYTVAESSYSQLQLKKGR